jgi:hypothetical protein
MIAKILKNLVNKLPQTYNICQNYRFQSIVRIKAVSILVAILAIAYSFSAFSQVNEWGLEGGACNYFGDLNQNNSFFQPRPAFGVLYRKNYNHYFALRTNLNLGQGAYDEKLSSNPFRKYQNLNVRTSFAEITSMIEFNFFKYVVEKDTKENRFTPFIAAGLGLGFFIPQAKYNNKWYQLPSYHTESNSYAPLMLELPCSFGFKYRIKRGLTFTVETMYHFLGTDYFDDVSRNYPKTPAMDGLVNITDPSASTYRLGDVPNKQRGNQFNDAILLTYISLSYTIVRQHCPMPSTDPLEVW